MTSLRTVRVVLAFAAVFAAAVLAIPSAPAQTFTVLHSFTGGADGGYPYSGLILDKAGNLYGTTAFGGASNNGTVFKISKRGKEIVLHSFRGRDGANP